MTTAILPELKAGDVVERVHGDGRTRYSVARVSRREAPVEEPVYWLQGRWCKAFGPVTAEEIAAAGYNIVKAR